MAPEQRAPEQRAPEQSQQKLDELAGRFTVHQPTLRGIAQRTLGSPWAADDAVQETWLRLQRADVTAIKNLEAWLTTVVSRVCIDLIRQRVSWREDSEDSLVSEIGSASEIPVEEDPARVAVLSDDLALAMHVVLDHLGPLERLALVLHDVFALPYDEIAPIVERTPTAARQLASRARARLKTVDASSVRVHQEGAIEAFLAAARDGDFGDLLQLLDPEIELRSDQAAVDLAAAGADHGAPLLDRSIRGSDAVARVFAGRAELTRAIRLEGRPAAAYVADGMVQAVYLLTFREGRIERIDVLADSARLEAAQRAL
ncbi:sigma-70 family RNA polymerase sigma factor [Brachybacterium sp. AOP35-5H-19]|uniref:sigma-70 family RNA polymerase sigma factor n=1 Tax=Brachybacterium sp. AOP35-5H-19 TaxID=3457685 RepID=UPI004034E4C0